MRVPETIRKVARPVNTVVEDSGRDGPNRYIVRERSSIRYVPGGNPQPKNGKVIGHIIDGVYVPVSRQSSTNEPDMLSYGGAAFVKSVTDDIVSDLLEIYPPHVVYTIMALVSVRILKPSIGSNRIASQYQRSFVSRDYPGASLSKNSIHDLLQSLGQDGVSRIAFYQKRIDAVSEKHHIAIDGTLKQDSTRVNDLSAFSYKSRVRGCQDISLLYAYDIDLMEPICAEVFPGNSIDATSYSSFIRDNNLQKGIIIADKGFPPSRIQRELDERPNLHFLTPIKRNDSRIQSHHMLDWAGVLDEMGKQVLFKKSSINDNRFLYAFKDVLLAAAEEESYLMSLKKNKKDFDMVCYENKRQKFGVIVFESDLDLPPRDVYLCYDDRWLLELVFRSYKNDECLDQTRVQGDFTVIGSEYVNFIATLATCRMIRKARLAGLLKNMSFGELLDDLNSAWRKTSAPTPPSSDDGYWVHTLMCVFDELEALGLSIPAPKPEPKKRGRPPKRQMST